MAGRISWQLALDGSDNVIRSLREIDRLFASINRNSQGMRGFGFGGFGGGGNGGGGGGTAGWPPILISGGRGPRGSAPSSAAAAIPPSPPTKPTQVLGTAYGGIAGTSYPSQGSSTALANLNWSKLHPTSVLATASPSSAYLANQASKRPWDVAMSQWSQYVASFTNKSITKPNLMEMLKKNLFGKTTDMDNMMGLDSQKFIKDMLKVTTGVKGVPGWLRWGIPGKDLPMVPGAATQPSGSAPLTLTNLGKSFGAGGSGYSANFGAAMGGGSGGPPIAPITPGGGGSGGGGGFWSKLFKLDDLAKHFLALFSIVKLLQKAFEFLKHTVQETSNIYRTAAMTGHGLGAVAGITNGLGSIGMDAGSAQTLLLNAQFRKGNQTSLYDTALGAGRSVGSKGLIQQIENMKPYLDNWEHSMKRVDDALADNSKMAFELTFVWHKFTVSLTGVVSELVTSAGPQLINVLGNLATALKYLGQVMHFVNSIDLVSKVTTWMNKQQGFIPGSVPDFKQSFGNKAGNSNLSGWERMGLVINSGVGHESHLSEISKNTKETAVTLKQLFSKEATFGDLKDYFKQSFNAP